MRRVGDISRHEQGLAARLLHPVGGLLRVFIFAEIGDDDIRALASECDGDRPAYPGVAAGDDRRASFEAATAAVAVFAVIGRRIEARRVPGGRLLLLRERRARPCAAGVFEHGKAPDEIGGIRLQLIARPTEGSRAHAART